MRNGKFTLALLCLAAIFHLSGCTPPPEGIIYVDLKAPPRGGDGKSWGRAFNDLQIGIDKAVPGNEVWVAAGVYTPTRKLGGNSERHRSFQLKSGIKVYGGFKGTENSRSERDWKINKTILSGDLNGNDERSKNHGENSYHVVTGNDTDTSAVIDGFTIMAGNANKRDWPDDGGGGMNNNNGNPTVRNCTFTANQAFADGGGMRNWGSSEPKILKSKFIGNYVTQEGGGMMNGPGSKPTVLYCKFFGNRAGEDGGGMYNNESYDALIINCVFTNNSADLTGGGMYNVNSSSPLVLNCSFSRNTAKKAGGGMSNNNGNPKVVNSIIWGNSAPGHGEIYNTAKSGPEISYSNVGSGFKGQGNIDKDPLFADQELRLSGESPCIEAGDNEALPEFIKMDFEGGKRIIGRYIDMGAFEYRVKK